MNENLLTKVTPIGFVILINPFSPLSQTERLIRKLNEMFDFPPIACHHDFGKNPNFVSSLPENVKLVTPHIDTKWADFSCIEAAVAAIRLLYSSDDKPEWFVYLSGADYPIKSAARILADLQTSLFDAHIEHLPVENKLREPHPSLPRPEGYKGRGWIKYCHKRFCSVRVQIPWITKRLSFTTKTLWLNQPLFAHGRLPFSRNFKCYAGEAWWCANYKAAEAILKFYDRDVAFAKHCRTVLVPEECYFHTVLANDATLRLSQNYLRYIDWKESGSHPKILDMEDLPAMKRSDAHFARKFADSEVSDVLTALDLT